MYICIGKREKIFRSVAKVSVKAIGGQLLYSPLASFELSRCCCCCSCCGDRPMINEILMIMVMEMLRLDSTITVNGTSSFKWILSADRRKWPRNDIVSCKQVTLLFYTVNGGFGRYSKSGSLLLTVVTIKVGTAFVTFCQEVRKNVVYTITIQVRLLKKYRPLYSHKRKIWKLRPTIAYTIGTTIHSQGSPFPAFKACNR